jgi:hypothetical protein
MSLDIESHALLVGNYMVLLSHSIIFHKLGWQTFCQLHMHILFDDYLKQAYTDIIFLFVTTNIHLRYLYLLNLLIVYKVNIYSEIELID